MASILLKESGGIPLIIIEILRLWEQDNLIYYKEDESSWILENEITNKYNHLFEIDIETNFSERLNTTTQNNRHKSIKGKLPLNFIRLKLGQCLLSM